MLGNLIAPIARVGMITTNEQCGNNRVFNYSCTSLLLIHDKYLKMLTSTVLIENTLGFSRDAGATLHKAVAFAEQIRTLNVNKMLTT
jgi:hypothetical protein